MFVPNASSWYLWDTDITRNALDAILQANHMTLDSLLNNGMWQHFLDLNRSDTAMEATFEPESDIEEEVQ